MVVNERRIPAGRRTMTLDDLERERRLTIEQIQHCEVRLSKSKMRGRRLRRGGLVALHLEEREGLKANLTKLLERLRTITAAIKAGRRSGMALLLTGHQMPNDERSLIATLYRMYIDAMPPADQNEYQQGIMAMARDYVMSGASVFGR